LLNWLLTKLTIKLITHHGLEQYIHFLFLYIMLSLMTLNIALLLDRIKLLSYIWQSCFDEDLILCIYRDLSMHSDERWEICKKRLHHIWWQIKHNTVKLGYNELSYNKPGYNEHPAITNKISSLGWFGSFNWCSFPVITNWTRL